MKLTLERSTFLGTMSHAQSVVEKRNTLPILSNVLIHADKNQETVTIRATDLDIEIVEEIESASVHVAGATTVSAHMLYDIVKKLPDGAQIDLQTNEGSIHIQAGRSKFTLATLSQDDFPVVASPDYNTTYTVTSGILQKLLDKVKFAISNEETRHYLGGIYLHVVGDKLRGVATDGHRLAQFDTPLPDAAREAPGVIVPRKTVTELRKLLTDADAPVDISVSETKIRFVCQGVTLTSRVIDGSFPDYSRVIPTGNTRILEVDPDRFSSSVDRVATVSSERTRAVKMALSKDTLALSVNSPEHGNAIEELDVLYTDEEMEIGFNARYLQEVMNQIEGDTAHFCFADSNAPTLVKDHGDENALYVVMPMRV